MNVGIWTISVLSILGVLFRPGKLPEWVWVICGSMLLLVFRLVPLHLVLHAMGEGIDVYLFLIGMMLLSEQARSEGLFDGLAGWAKTHARGSALMLFILIYAAGVVVTAFLSNDATAVVLTPAVYVAVKRAGAKPLPYLFACALVANAAGFILPISNPANLVVFGSHPPGVTAWVKAFGLPALASVGVTFLVLWFWFRQSLSAPLKRAQEGKAPQLSECGKLTAGGIIAVVIVLMVSSFFEWNLGLPTFLAAFVIVAGIAVKKRRFPAQILKEIAWGVIPLVAGLFIMVEAMNRAGALKIARGFFEAALKFPAPLGKLAAAFGVAVSTNLLNNLPVGLMSGIAVHQSAISGAMRNAVLLGVDLGPNLSVNGSLSTILWLMAMRREGEKVSGFAFLKLGLIAMPLALGLAVLLT